MNDFYAILPSNTRGSPNNCASHFNIVCNNPPINLNDGSWSVGVTELSFYKNSVTAFKESCGYTLRYEKMFNRQIVINALPLSQAQLIEPGVTINKYQFYLSQFNPLKSKLYIIPDFNEGALKAFQIVFQNVEDAKKCGFNNVKTSIQVQYIGGRPVFYDSVTEKVL